MTPSNLDQTSLPMDGGQSSINLWIVPTQNCAPTVPGVQLYSYGRITPGCGSPRGNGGQGASTPGHDSYPRLLVHTLAIETMLH